MSEAPSPPTATPPSSSTWRQLVTTEDGWAIWLGLCILLMVWCVTAATFPDELPESGKVVSPLLSYAAKLSGWEVNPVDAVYVAPTADAKSADAPKPVNHIPGLIAVGFVGLIVFGIGKRALGVRFAEFAPGYIVLFGLVIASMVIANQSVVKAYNLEYALWALAIGVLINLTVGTPQVLRPALATEFYIKTGLVLLGAELLLPQLVKLGIPGFCVAWICTPITFITTYIFGQKVLKMESRSLNMVISADMSVCGVSAAIATAAACKAKKEELTLAIGISLAFTVIMMAVMPAIIRATGMSEILGGAWIGGTIDSTGAVAAAGELVGAQAQKVVTTVKLLQNILIGFLAFGVATYWVRVVERLPDANGTATDAAATPSPPPSLWVIWERFPKFILGFFAASALATLVVLTLPHGEDQMKTSIEVTKSLMTWFFALAFVSIGLEIDFAQFRESLKGGKPLVLYICGQALNLLLTFTMAWVMFENVFKEQVEEAFAVGVTAMVQPIDVSQDALFNTQQQAHMQTANDSASQTTKSYNSACVPARRDSLRGAPLAAKHCRRGTAPMPHGPGCLRR